MKMRLSHTMDGDEHGFYSSRFFLATDTLRSILVLMDFVSEHRSATTDPWIDSGDPCADGDERGLEVEGF